MWGCSCRGDGGADRAMQHVPTSKGYRGIVHERTGHQTRHCLVVVGFSMAGDLDAHRHLGGIAANRVIGSDHWLTLHLPGQTLVGGDLCVQALLCCCGERGYEWPRGVVDICLGHHREVIGVLPVMKSHRVLDRDTRQAAEPVEVKGSDIALWPDDCSMRGHGGLALNRGIARRDDRRGIPDDPHPLAPAE